MRHLYVSPLVILISILSGVPSLAQTPTPTLAPPSTGIDGQIGISPWHQRAPSKPNEINFKYRFQVNGWINVTPDGCLKIKARVTTGPRFNNEWINSGVGTEPGELKVSLRQVYVSSECWKKMTIEAGSVPVHNFGNMGLSDNGSITGVNVIIHDQKHRREWIVSGGGVEPEAHLFKRKFEKPNHVSLQVKQAFGNRVEAYASVSHHEDAFYSRTGLRYVANDSLAGKQVASQYMKWLRDTGFDLLFSDKKAVGFMGYTRFNVQKWGSRIAFSSINPNPTQSDRIAYGMKQFYGFGKNIYLETSRNVSPSLTLNGRMRIGNAGPNNQVGLTWRFNAVKKKKKR